MIDKFADNILFKDISRDELASLIEVSSYSFHRFEADNIILRQGDPYNDLYLLLAGNCISRMTDFKGREMKIERFEPGIVFAPAVLFASNNDMPGSVIAQTIVEVAVFSKECILSMCSMNAVLLSNFMGLLSDKFMFISKRLEMMSFKTIREKLANYLLGLHQDADGRLYLPVTVEELSSFFGISRPSLSRIFSRLEAEGVIEKDRRMIKIHDIDTLLSDAPDE